MRDQDRETVCAYVCISCLWPMRFLCLWLMMIKCLVDILRRTLFHERERERQREREREMWTGN